MAAVTQLTPNFLGGVSRQVDDKKLDGQVVDITNAYPDPTYGLVKRNSTSYLYDLKRPVSERPFEEDELDNAFWFYAETKTEVTSDNASDYPTREVGDVWVQPWLCCIKDGQVYVWNSVTGQPQIVFNAGVSYLTKSTNSDGSKNYYGPEVYHARTILDTVIICNRNKTTEMVENNATFTAGLVGTVRINTVVSSKEYAVVLDGSEYTYTLPDGEGTGDLLQGLVDAIPNEYNPTKYKASIELRKSTPFSLEVRDGASNVLMNSYQDTALNQTLLAQDTVEGRLVEITGDQDSVADNYYLRYTNGNWEETVNPTVDVEPDATTMPHQLIYNEAGEWIFQPIDFTNRLVGDDDSNPVPSFIGETINASFYYNNRLGFLSGPNVILSQAKDVYNFFGESQITATDADPIDVNANSTRPTDLYEVVTQPQGVLLFGTRQQFWMSSPETGVLTPTRTVIKAISSFESDKDISPLDIGTQIGFVSKSPDFSKLMLMQGQGSDVDPVVVDISKVVSGWLPRNVNRMACSPQNSLIILTGKDEKNVYLYRFYNDGQEDRMQAWSKWHMPGEVQALNILNDTVFSVTKQSDRYVTTWVSLNNLSQSGPQFSEDEYKPGGPYLDLSSKPESVVYSDGETKFYTKFPLLTDREPRMVLTLPSNPGIAVGGQLVDRIRTLQQLPRTTEDDPGYWAECEQGTDDTGNYFKVRGNFSGYTNGVTIGYSYDYEVILPKFYFKMAAKNNAADYSAHLNINRVKFAVGLTGGVTFKLKALGSEEWVDIQHVTDADYYDADTDPLQTERLFTVPINQRNKNFQLKVTSDLPFPVSLVSMMWEGQYTPRFYRRT